MDCSHFTEVFTDSALSYIHMATVLLVSLYRVPMEIPIAVLPTFREVKSRTQSPRPVNTFVYIRGVRGHASPGKILRF